MGAISEQLQSDDSGVSCRGLTLHDPPNLNPLTLFLQRERVQG